MITLFRNKINIYTYLGAHLLKISFFSTQKFDIDIFDEENAKHSHQIQYHEFHLNPHTVNAIEPSDVVCCFVNDKVNRTVIDVLAEREVKLIAMRCSGFNNIDYRYALEKKIATCRVPAYSPEAIAEHAMALILCLNRKIHHAHSRVRQGNFSLDGLMGFNLYKKTVGIIGTGKIGSALAKILIGFDCEVLAYDPIISKENVKLGVQYVSLNKLLHSSDIISLHCPLNDSTRFIINHETLAMMKTGVMLINTGRGQLVQTKAVIEALKNKKLGYLGLDVYEEEEELFFEDHSEDIITDDIFCRLQTFPNVLITGHQGFFTYEAISHIARTTLNNISNFVLKKEPMNLIYK